jgi:hypothetical protein
VPFEFDAMIELLNVDLTDRLQEEPVPSTRVAQFGFPGADGGAQAQLFRLSSIRSSSRPAITPTRRCAAFYFTPARRKGRRSIRSSARSRDSFGAEEVSAHSIREKGEASS